MDLVNIKTGAVEPVANADEAIRSGTHTFAKGQRVAVQNEDGKVGHLDAEEAMRHMHEGSVSLVSEERARKAALDRKYGGVGGTLAALGEGAIRGATMGLSDPAAIEAARVVGGDETAEKVRKHLAEAKEAHPYAALGSELVGTAAPLLLSGGAAAPEEAGALAASLRAGTAAPRLTAELGEAGGALARALVGTEGAAGAAIHHGIAGAIEGSAYGMGTEISENALNGGNHELTAEQLLAAAGHGALAGGVLGAGLGAFGHIAAEHAEPVIGKVKGFLGDLAKGKAAEAAGAGGIEGAGDFVLNEIPKAAGKDLERMTLDEMQGAALKIKAEALGEIDKHAAAMDALGKDMPAVDPSSRLRSVVDDLRGKAEHADTVEAMNGLVGDFEAGAGMKRVTKAEAATMPPELVQQIEGRLNAGARVTYKDLRELTAKIDALPPSAEMGKLKMAAESSMLDHLKGSGAGELGDAFVAARERAEKARLIEDATARKLAEIEQSPQVGLAKALGMQHAMMGLVMGHPVAALTAVATGAARHLVAERGAQVVAGMANKLAYLSAAEHAVNTVTKTIRGTMQAYVSRAAETFGVGPASTKLAKGIGRGVGMRAGYEREVESAREAVKDPAAFSQRVGMNMGELPQHAPGVATALAAKSAQVAQYVAAQIPPASPGPSQMQPQIKGPPPSEMEMSRFLRVAAVAKRPLSILSELRNGHLSFDQVDAVKACYPKLYGQMQEAATAAIAARPTLVPYEKRKRLSVLLGIPLDPTLDGALVQRIQATYGGPSQQAVAQGGPTERPGRGRDNQKARKADLKSYSAGTATQFEAATTATRS